MVSMLAMPPAPPSADVAAVEITAFFRKIRSGLSKIFGAIAHTSKGAFGKINKIRSSAMQKLHKPLQKSTSLMYNIKRRKASNRGSESGHVIKAKVTRSNNP